MVSQISLRVTLANVERECAVLPDPPLIMREQLRTGGPAEAIQHLDAKPFGQMADFERTDPSLPGAVLRIRVDLSA